MPGATKEQKDATFDQAIFDGLVGILKEDFDRVTSNTEEIRTKVHIFIEAGHSQQLGRPADLVLNELLIRRMYSDLSGIEIHFIEDRMKIPQELDGHIICLGGPRSNVLARAALEYEVAFNSNPQTYRRIASPSIRHAVNFTSEDEEIDVTGLALDGPVMQRIKAENPDYIDHVKKQFDILDDDPSALPLADRFRLYSPGRVFWTGGNNGDNGAGLPQADKRHSLSLREINTLGDQHSHELREHLIYDHTLLTVMPNVFASDPSKYRLFIYQGLRSLGTLAALRILSDKAHLKDLKTLLKKTSSVRKTGQVFFENNSAEEIPFHQVIWSVHRTKGSWTTALSPTAKDLSWFPNEPMETDGSKVSHGELHQYKVKWETIKAFASSLITQEASTQSVRKALVRINQIDAGQILSAMALQRINSSAKDNIYALGCFEHTKTVYTQQARAYTLIHALHKAGKIGPQTHIAVVGGGASGIAAAIAANLSGVKVTLLDAADKLMSSQRKASHRCIDPYIYDWPDLIRHDHISDLRHLNWKTGDAAKVRKQIVSKFKMLREKSKLKHSDGSMFGYIPDFKVQQYFYNSRSRQHCIMRRSVSDIVQSSMAYRDGDRSKSDPAADFDAAWDVVLLGEELTKLCGITNADELRAKRIEINQKIAQVHKWVTDPNNPQSKSDPNFGWSLSYPEVIACDILIFATGFGEEDPEFHALQAFKSSQAETEDTPINEEETTSADAWAASQGTSYRSPDNKSYWVNDHEAFETIRNNVDAVSARMTHDSTKIEEEHPDRRTVVISGAGDGALIDILRLVVDGFEHETIIRKFTELASSDADAFVREVVRFSDLRERRSPDVASSKQRSFGTRLKEAGEALDSVVRSDEYRLLRASSDRLSRIAAEMRGFGIKNLFQDLGIELRNVLIYLVDHGPQPFGAESATFHRLLVYSLFLNGRVRFFEGKVINRSPNLLTIKTFENRECIDVHNPQGYIVRHGVGKGSGKFLDEIDGLLRPGHKTSEEIVDYGQRLIALLNLTNGMHPETYKFYNYTVRAFG